MIWSHDDGPLWAKDGSPLPIAHPQAFRCIDGRWFTDGEHVIVQAQQGSGAAWYYFYRIENADIATFEVLNERYARDARQAYFIAGKTIRTRSPQPAGLPAACLPRLALAGEWPAGAGDLHA